MDCRILRQITLKADGHLGCDDSVGYSIDLGHVSTNRGWKLRNILNGPIYSHIRRSFAEGKVPWPGTCERCDLFSDTTRPNDTLNHRIDLLIEPTLACELTCACCIRKSVIAKGRSTDSLDISTLDRLLVSCASDNIAVGELHYIGQGEPLMHDNFHGLFDVAKARAPGATQVVTTTGNVDFRSTVGDSSLDRLVVSCDGPRQDVYQRYRKGGHLEAVFKFMRDCKRYGDPTVFLEWKYIVFEFTDSEDDLILAQKIADDIGVDSLLFIITNSKWRSQRYNVDNIRQFPIVSKIARVNPSAAMSVSACENSHFTPLESARVGHGWVDLCSVSIGKMLNVEGWALDRSGKYAHRVELVIDGVTVATDRPYHRRADVVAAHPGSEGDKCGFIFRLPISTDALPKQLEVRIVGESGIASLGGRTNWLVRGAAVKARTDIPNVNFGAQS
jgi:hypothetical protein